MAAETPDQNEEQQEYGYTIEGEICPEPESLTIDDHRIIKRYTGYNFRDLAAMDRNQLYVDQDGIAAILHISYRHAHEDLSFDEIAEIIGRQDLDTAQSTLEQLKVEGSEDPLALKNKLESESDSPESDSTQTETPKNSGDDSRKSSDPSEDQHATTTTLESAMSSPESDPETEAA